MPIDVEQGFHPYEEMCGEGCAVSRAYRAELPDCPSPTCNDTASAVADDRQTIEDRFAAVGIELVEIEKVEDGATSHLQWSID